MRLLRLLLLFAVVAGSPAQADGIVKNAAEAAAKYMILKGAKHVARKGVQRLGSHLAQVAKQCFKDNAKDFLQDALTDEFMTAVIDAYPDEIVERSGVPIPDAQRGEVVKDFFDNEGMIRSKSETAEARARYASRGMLADLREKWSAANGMDWPRGENSIGSNGIVEPGKPAQWHHILPLKRNGDPVDPRNGWPLLGTEHQQGIHKGRRGENLLRTIFACFDRRKAR